MENTVLKNKYLQRVVWIGLFLSLWEITVRLKLFSVLLLPPPGEVVKAFFRGILDGDLLQQIALSLLLLLLGFILSLAAAVVSCYLGYYHRHIQSFLDICLVIFHPLPGVALLPLIILWAGIGTKAVLFVILHSILWPMIINLQTGFRSIDISYIEAAKNNGVNRWQLYRYVLLPLSMPNLSAGLQIGWSRGWRALISAEMIFGAIGSVGGIGWYIYEKRVFMDTPGMYAGLLAMIIIGFLVEDVFFSRIDLWIRQSCG